MRLDGPAIVWAGVGLVLATAVLLSAVWDAGRARPRLFRQVAAVVACVLSVAVTVALQVNRMTEAYPTWTALTGAAAAASRPDPPAGRTSTGGGGGRQIALRVPPAEGSRAGQLVSISVTGLASGLTLPAYVYLPAAYRAPADRRTTFPVIEALHGFPGSPRTWLDKLHVQRYLDQEISSGRMPPTVAVFPRQTTSSLLDTECTNLAHGPQVDTFLTTDVPAAVQARFRVRTDREGWALVGYSAGAFCAINLVLRHPDRYVAAASLSGYAEPGIPVGDGSEHTFNNPAWRLRHLPRPPIGLYLAYANDDKVVRRDCLILAQLARSPVSVTTAVIPYGGHTGPAWEAMEAPTFDWLGGWLARPIPQPHA